MYSEFGKWFTDSIIDLETNDIPFKVDYLSIQNEPKLLPEYHSCLLAPKEKSVYNGVEYAGYSEAFNACWETLAIKYYDMGKTIEYMPKFLATETTGISGTAKIKEIPQKYIDEFDKTKLHRIYAYAHHSYQNVSSATFPDHLNDDMVEFKNKNDYKPLFQTEFAILPSNSDDSERTNGRDCSI